MKKLLTATFMVATVTLGFAAPAEAHTTTVWQGRDWAIVVDGPNFAHDRVKTHDSECDGNLLRTEAVLQDGSRYTMWNFEGCRETHISTLNKKIESFRLCEVNICSPWRAA